MADIEAAYFLTVDWCEKGHWGIMCDKNGQCFRKDEEPHTALEMQDIIGPFWIILSPRSELLTKDQVDEFTWWIPLEEYEGQFGVALKPD